MKPGPPPLVTVVTNAFNASRYLTEAIDSIRNQTFQDWEYVVVDDASDDNTGEIAEAYARDDARFRVIRRRERGGPYAAANEGFRHARGRYVARLDADDVALPHRLERQLEFMSDNPTLHACVGHVMRLVDGEPRHFDIGELPILPGALKWRLVVRWGFMPSTTLIERTAFEEIGGFRELPLSQDHRLWCELARRRWLGVVPEVLAYWRVHDEQLSMRQQPLQESLGIDIIREHLSILSKESWTETDVRHLRAAGEWPVPLLSGFRLIRRYERLWRADTALTAQERVELTRLTRDLRAAHRRVGLRHARRSFANRVTSTNFGRHILRQYGTMRTSIRGRQGAR